MAGTQKSPRKEVRRPVWAEVSLGALTYNLEAIRKYVNPPQEERKSPRKILSIVKGNGYGKGAGEGRLGLVWRDLDGRGNCRSQGRGPKADPGAHEFRAGRRIPAGGARPHGGDPSLRTIGVTQSRGRPPRRQEGRAVPFEDRYGNEPAGHRFRRRGVLCTATWEVQAPAAYRHLFALCLIGSFHGYRGWPADMRARRAILLFG